MRTSPTVRRLAAVKPRWLALALLLLTVLLLAGDLASRHTDLALFSGDSRWHRWDGRRDRGWMELAGYLQLVIAAVLLVPAARHRGPGGRVLAAWAVVVVVVVLDDGWMLHERGGQTGLPQLVGIRGFDRLRLCWSARWRGGWDAVSCRHTTSSVSLDCWRRSVVT